MRDEQHALPARLLRVIGATILDGGLFLAAGLLFIWLAGRQGIVLPNTFLAVGAVPALLALPLRLWSRTALAAERGLLIAQLAWWVGLAVIIRPIWPLTLAVGAAHAALSLAVAPRGFPLAWRLAAAWLLAVAAIVRLADYTPPGTVSFLLPLGVAALGALGLGLSLRLPRRLGLPAGRELETLAGQALQGQSALESVQAEYARFRAQAEVEIAHRTRALAQANAELQRALAAAEAAEKSKALAYRMLSHELRAPLTTIQGLIQAILSLADAGMTGWENGLLDDLRVIGEQAESLLQVVDDLLDLARARDGRLPCTAGVVNLGVLVHETVEAQRRLAAPGVEWRLHVEPAVRAWADPEHARRMVVNLVSNAVKYTTAGRIVVAVQTRQGWALLGVQDTGPGIPAERLAQVFEPFADGGNGPAPRPGFRSTGLGLPLTRALAHANGGEVVIESRTDGLQRGTSVWLRLPIPPDTDDEERRSTPERKM